jgi:hypothetical protein
MLVPTLAPCKLNMRHATLFNPVKSKTSERLSHLSHASHFPRTDQPSNLVDPKIILRMGISGSNLPAVERSPCSLGFGCRVMNRMLWLSAPLPQQLNPRDLSACGADAMKAVDQAGKTYTSPIAVGTTPRRVDL